MTFLLSRRFFRTVLAVSFGSGSVSQGIVAFRFACLRDERFIDGNGSF